MKWDYRLLPLPKDRDEHVVRDMLQAVGQEGWELVTIYEQAAIRIFVVKRPHPSSP
jgi:hypothetical protein